MGLEAKRSGGWALRRVSVVFPGDSLWGDHSPFLRQCPPHPLRQRARHLLGVEMLLPLAQTQQDLGAPRPQLLQDLPTHPHSNAGSHSFPINVLALAVDAL